MAILFLLLSNFLANEILIIFKWRFELGAIHDYILLLDSITRGGEITAVNVAVWAVAGDLVLAPPYQTVPELMNLVMAFGTSSLE